MILTDTDIKKRIESGRICISPFDESCVKTNSYDVHLSQHLMCYATREIDAKAQNKTRSYIIPPEGKVLLPGILYLGSTIEHTESHYHVSFLEGKSSVGRLGISVHATAGVGDIGFCGHWTLELSVVQPVKVYAGMPIAQLLFFVPMSTPHKKYGQYESKYQDQGEFPVPSKMWKNFK